jgi:hypothetical protein
MMRRERFTEEYLKILDPIDVENWQYDTKDHGFWVKHQIAHHVDPHSIVELGVRSGYSAWAMLIAMPKATYVGYDSYDPKYAAAYDHLTDSDSMSAHFYSKALSVLHGFGSTELIVADTQDPTLVLPTANLYHVDAGHTVHEAVNDIRKCVAVMLHDSVIAVHDFMAASVRCAVMTVAREASLKVCEIVEPINGDALLYRGATPKWMYSIGGKEVKSG